METNRERALNYIENYRQSGVYEGLVPENKAKEAIELAATPNWNYPNKGEICNEIDKRILIIHMDNNKTNYVTLVTTVQNVAHQYKTLLYDADADDYYSWDDVKVWTNLPQL